MHKITFSSRIVDGDTSEKSVLQPSSGEIHYLWCYMQGSIMNLDVRLWLHDAWGFCERHAWLALMVETSFRRTFLMGPAMLYEDILGLAVKQMNLWGPMKHSRRLTGLREKRTCLICDMGWEHVHSSIPEERLNRGNDASHLKRFALKTKAFWDKMVCGICNGTQDGPRCRIHLLEDASSGQSIDFERQRDMISYLHKHISIYSEGFRWERRGTSTIEDAAALIAAVGWCSGWKPLLALMALER